MGLRSGLVALTYDRLMAIGEKAGLAAIRSTLLAEATGDVLEVGAGTGLNLTPYPGEVSALTATEPDGSMLRRLQRAADRTATPTRVLRAPAEDLPFEDATFDTVVSTLVLCGVEDQPGPRSPLGPDRSQHHEETDMAIADNVDIAAQRDARLVRANGIDIAYTDVGDGPPLVLLHAAWASTGPARAGPGIAYVDHLTTLAKHFRVIAPDTRGSGATGHPGGPVTFDVLTADVLALLDALDLDRTLIAGFSEGAATATLVARSEPTRIQALVNHAGFDYFEAHEAMAAQIRMMFGGGPDATEADPAAAERTLAEIPPMAANFATMQADYDDAQGDGYWCTYLGQFFDCHVAPFGHITDDLASLAIPTLILTGDRDMFCSVEAACVAYRTLEAGELGIVANTGHDITGAVIDVMVGFLRAHTASARGGETR